MIKKNITLLTLLLCSLFAHANNPIGGWYMYFGNASIKNSNFKVHYELQHRNRDLPTDLNQLLIRTALQYNLNNQITFGAGYGFIDTDVQGDNPKSFKENRLYQEALTQQSVGKVALKHRFRYEQRFIEDTDFKTRFRYQLGIDIPLTKRDNQRDFYATFYNEVFINGEKLENTDNLFDRNRLFFGAGYKIKNNLNIQLGWMNQMTEKVSNQQIMLSIHHNLKI